MSKYEHTATAYQIVKLLCPKCHKELEHVTSYCYICIHCRADQELAEATERINNLLDLIRQEGLQK
jgi:hypothetical protein